MRQNALEKDAASGPLTAQLTAQLKQFAEIAGPHRGLSSASGIPACSPQSQ
ncbi:hypothetical protein [Glutamicibacter sp.]|jgi:hypothetical protein|uniref:hypothetical protein n=1 Tax=Glutamicibacter sp. TaxID=1931995 RepID=UPI002B48AC2B|nr:hypothetical protein [Glutamicibacter sp.]HJX79357.1 hypothetical protein [Glutamicibacter sp.]